MRQNCPNESDWALVLPRISLRGLLLGVALISILMLIPNAGGCGSRSCFIADLAFSPDGRRLAVAMFNSRRESEHFKSYAADVCRTVEVRDLSRIESAIYTKQEFRAGDQGPLRVVRPVAFFHQDDDTLVITGWYDFKHSQGVVIEDLTGGNPPRRLDIQLEPFFRPRAAVYSLDGTILAALNSTHGIDVWSLRDGRIMSSIACPGTIFSAEQIALSPDGALLAVAHEKLEIFDTATGKSIKNLSENRTKRLQASVVRVEESCSQFAWRCLWLVPRHQSFTRSPTPYGNALIW